MQGFNMGRYLPPASQDAALSGSKTGGFNSQKGHPLGSRFSKVKEGIITIRFETPFDIWCETCTPEFLIKQGVRWNAQKKKTGHYLSSPIYEFSFRHPPCGAIIAIKTDPENTQYVVSAGGRKKAGAYTTAFNVDYGEIITEEERERRRNDAFARLEGQSEEKTKAKSNAARIEELMKLSERQWKDPYRMNRLARDQQRPERKRREANEADKEAISELYGLGFELLDYTKEDAESAAAIEFGETPDEEQALERALSKPLFSATSPDTLKTASKPAGIMKSSWKQKQRKASFQRDVIANTMAKRNPFSANTDWLQPRRTVPKVRSIEVDTGVADLTERELLPELSQPQADGPTLVGYAESEDDSDV